MGSIKIRANEDVPAQENREAEGNLPKNVRWQMFLQRDFCWEEKAGFIQVNSNFMSPGGLRAADWGVMSSLTQ